ncbi:MAG: (Fe-S)-binding protein [Caulobacterales bacterium]|nr:(Fe-S)-binding protein [Caulobacterales bacterium]
MITAREILAGDQLYTEEHANIVFKCTACGNCTSLCNSVDFDTGGALTRPHEVIGAMKADMAEAGLVPAAVKRYLRNVYEFGNAYAAPADERAVHLQDLPVDTFERTHDYLLYIGDVGSYDPRARSVVRSLVQLLQRADVSFGVLGAEEKCDGNEVNFLGERALFRHISEENIDLYRAKGVARIITLSPHAYNAFKRDYPAFGSDFEAVHYTQFLASLIEKGVLAPKTPFDEVVTYHDPCFLGRHNNEYHAPRAVLTSIPGLQFVEMPRNKENALCCGGGAANAFTDVLGGGANRPSRHRIREAYDAGARVLAVACPQCMIMFEDGLKGEGLAADMRVLDIAEILHASC